MTHSIDAPLPPPATTTGTGSPSTTERAQETKDVAKGEARNVSQTASQAGSQVAATASDQAREVAQETQRQAKDLLDQGRAQLTEQATTQQQKAAASLSSLATELRSLADGTSSGAPGPARDLLQQASSSVENFASMLQNREPAELLDEVRNFARRKPGMFLLGAAVAGVVAGRLTSGVKAAHSESSSGAGSIGAASPGTNYVDPAPSYSGYPGTAAPGVDTTTTTGTTGAAPLPPPPYGTVPPASPAGWDDPARRPGGVG